MKTEVVNEIRRAEFVFIKAHAVTVTRTGNLLVKLNSTTGISLHPNYIAAILNPNKKAA